MMVFRPGAVWLGLWVAAAFGPSGFGLGTAQAAQAPAFLITGSYFPAWMFFLLVGIVGSVLIRAALIRLGLDDLMPLRVLAYTALAMAITFALLLVGAPLP